MQAPDKEPPQQTGTTLTWPAPLLDIAYAILSRKWIVAAIIFVGLVLGVIRWSLMPPTYTASAVAVLLAREKPILDAAIETSSMESSDDSAGRSAVGTLMLPPDPTLYTTLINSRSVLEEIGERLKEELGDYLSPNDRSVEVYQQIKSMISVTSTENGLITVTVTSSSPRLSAKIANLLFLECERASKEIERSLILTQAGHLRDALISSEAQLRLTEEALSQFSAQFKIVDVDYQISNKLRNVRELQVERDRLQTELDDLRLSYAASSPEIQSINTRIASIENQLNLAESNILGSVPSAEYGRLIVEYESLKERIRFERDLVATLSTKVDIYEIRAEQPTGNLAVIRPASEPALPAGPSKKKEIGLVLGLFIVLAVGWALAAQQWQVARRDPTLGPQIDKTLQALKPFNRR
ncbi:MAG: hypothetical protein ACQKBT_06420 [Puniceicoccales bacterium]